MRLIIVRILAPKTIDVYDLSIASIMVPKGLAAAVLASLVTQAGLPSAEIVREVAFGVILFSICAVAFMTFLIERGWSDFFFNYIFGRATLAAEPAAAPDGAPPEA